MLFPSIPYPIREFLGMVVRRYSSPPAFDQEIERLITLRETHHKTIRVGFVGDICPLNDRKATMDQQVLDFFGSCDLMVGNFEGVITQYPFRPFLHKHTTDIFQVLELIKPLSKWTLSIANNHAIDYGDEALIQTIDAFNERDIDWLGTVERPMTYLTEDITVSAWTWWMNGKTERIQMVDSGVPSEKGLHLACPHWGYEHERSPRADQRQELPNGYDLITGHHSHLPQPLELGDESTPVAWSLGNFLTAKTLPVLGEGAVLKVTINLPDKGQPVLQSLHYKTILIDRDQPGCCHVNFRE